MTDVAERPAQVQELFEESPTRIFPAAYGQVNALAQCVLPDGSVVLASAGADGTVRLWDPADQSRVGQPMTGHTDWVRAVTAVTVGGRALLASAGDDGTVRLWDPADQRPVGQPMTGHTRWVLGLAAVTIGGRALLASGGSDGTVRLWDPADQTQVGQPMTGHTGSVWAVTAVTVDGRALLASAGDDRTVRLWDPADQTQVGQPMTGHTEWVRAVTAVTVDGRALLASAGGDATVRLWDPADQTQVGQPMTGHTGWVRAVTAVTVGGRALLASAGGADATVRLWDPADQSPVGQPMTGHTRWVRAVTAVTVGGRALLASAGDDSAILIWSETPGLGSLPDFPDSGHTPDQAPGVQPPEDVNDPLALVDVTKTPDLLGRASLAAHLDGLLARLASTQPEGTAVAHLDGRWGAGKSTLVELMLEPSLCGDVGEPRQLQDTVVVRYDAWRESAVAPEWWSVAAALNRGVGSSRAWPTRLVMLASGAVDRIRRTPSIFVAVAVLVAMLWVVNRYGEGLKSLGGLVTGLVGAIALALTVGRALFWTSPAFGRLDLKANDNPLGEIAEQVGRMRRWSPRRQREQRWGDWLLAVWLIGWAAFSFWQLFEPSSDEGARWWQLVRSDYWGLLPLGLTMMFVGLALYVVWLREMVHEKRAPILLLIDDLDRCSAVRVVRLLETVHTVLRKENAPKVMGAWRKPAPLIVLVLADGRWVRTAFEKEFADFRELGSDVHSLGADFIQKLFDHTVIVPTLTVDQMDRYVRRLSHSVDIEDESETAAVTAPALGEGSGGGMAAISGTDPATVDMETEQPDAPAEVDARTHEVMGKVRAALPGDVYGEELTAEISSLPESKRQQVEATRAAVAATEEATERRRRHLITRYRDLLPSNPRLIKRVADAAGMLMALGSYTNHRESQDVVYRAAIAMVRFPSLVDALLTDQRMPDEAGGSSTAGERAVESADAKSKPSARQMWERVDVQEVVGEVPGVGGPVTARQLARCYGRSLGEAAGAAPRKGEAMSEPQVDADADPQTDMPGAVPQTDPDDAGGHA